MPGIELCRLLANVPLEYEAALRIGAGEFVQASELIEGSRAAASAAGGAPTSSRCNAVSGEADRATHADVSEFAPRGQCPRSAVRGHDSREP